MTEFSPAEIDELRARTPGCRERIHFNNAGAALLSETTLTAMREQIDLESMVGGYESVPLVQDRIDATYRDLARLVAGQESEVALFDNSTHAWNAAFYSVQLEPGDRIVTGRDEYGSNLLAYLQVCRRTGAELVVIDNDGSGRLDTDALADAMDERVKVVGITWVPTAGGLINPAAEIGRIVRRWDALYLVDATQVVGQFPIDVGALQCDLLTGTGRKFLRGPRGTGFLWAGPRAIDRLVPHVVEIRSATWDGHRSFTWAAGARRFETWENSYVNILGLGAAVGEALDLGLERIGERAAALGSRLRSGLSGLADVTAEDLGTERCAIVTARIRGAAPDDVMSRLAAERISVSITVPEHNQLDTEVRDVYPLVRLSPHYYNTDEEIDRTIEAIGGMTGAGR